MFLRILSAHSSLRGHNSLFVLPPGILLKSLRICGVQFSSCRRRNLRIVNVKALFLLSLATIKRVGEPQAFTFRVAFKGRDLSLSYLPKFVVKTESERNLLPRSFLVKSLADFVGDLPEERFPCSVQAVRIYLDLTSSLSLRPRSLFVSPRCHSRSLSKNALSFFLRQVIFYAGAIQADSSGLPRAHSIGHSDFCCFFEELIDLQGVRGSNSEIESSFCLFISRICLTCWTTVAHSVRSSRLAQLSIDFVSFCFWVRLLLSLREDYVFIGVRLSVSVCLSICLCLFVCLLARKLKKLWMDFDEIFRKMLEMQ